MCYRITYLSALAARGTKTGLRSSSARHRRRSRPCICDQACGPPTLSVEKPLVGKISAALPRDGRESRRTETGDHMPGRRCLHDFAGGAVVKMPSLWLRERLLRSQRGPTVRCLLWPGWLNDVRCWARAQRHVVSGNPRRRRSLRYRVRLQASYASSLGSL